MRKKINDGNIERAILKLLDVENRFISIREITKLLDEKHNIKRSPQVIKRHIEGLVKKKKIETL